MRVLFLALLFIPQLASAEIYVCVDLATGKKLFTDMACDVQAQGDEIKVKQGNFGSSGSGQKRSSGQKVWRSQDGSNISSPEKYKSAGEYAKRDF
ncbi:MAG: hypothetical protein ACJAYC_003397 [Halieaceae bacterium]|jgi:hypothetical protein